MENRFREYIVRNRLFTADDRIVAGISGGIDSIVMMHLLKTCGYHIAAAHCNFSLRGEESDGDMEFVKRETERLGIRLHTVRFDTGAYARNHNRSIEMAARELRYGWFEELAETYGYSHIAIAHNCDDATETFFINLLRGTGIRGLGGIPRQNGRIVRPILFASRQEIETYASARGIGHREDSTNAETVFLRNKIRHRIVPAFRELSPQFGSVMSGNTERIGEAVRLIDSFTGRLAREISETTDGKTVIRLNPIEGFDPPEYLLYELLRPYGFDYDTTVKIYEAYRKGLSGRQFFGKKRRAVLDRGTLIVTETEPDAANAQAVYENDFSLETDRTEYRFAILEDFPEKLDQGTRTALLDADKLQFPLQIRKWRAGDRFYPLGMKKTKKVSDYLTDEKISLVEKERQQVVVSGEEIVWLTGKRIDERYKVTPDTARILKISI